MIPLPDSLRDAPRRERAAFVSVAASVFDSTGDRDRAIREGLEAARLASLRPCYRLRSHAVSRCIP